MNETETLMLPKTNKQVIVRGYITGYISQEVERVKLAANKMHYEMEIDPNAPKGPDGRPLNGRPQKAVMDSDPSVTIDAENKLIELMVVSVDGDPNNVLDRLLSLPVADVNYLKAELKKLENASKVGDEEKKG